MNEKIIKNLKRADKLEKLGLAYVLEIVDEIEDKLESADFSNTKEMLSQVRGKDGDKGEKGDCGEDGKDGIDGVDGKDGKDGANGRDGKDGKNGRDGKDGKDGKDGSPDTPTQIVEKIAKIGLPVEHVKGLEEKVTLVFGNMKFDFATKSDLELMKKQGLVIDGSMGTGPQFISRMRDVHIPNIAQGETLVWDATQKKFIAGTASGGGSSYTFENGLTNSSGTVRLGGTLNRTTTIDGSGTRYDMNFTNIGAWSLSGDDIYYNAVRNIDMQSDEFAWLRGSTVDGTTGLQIGFGLDDTSNGLYVVTPNVKAGAISTGVLNLIDSANGKAEFTPIEDLIPLSVNLSTITAGTSGGLTIEAANGTDIGLLGAGNTANVTWYGSHNFNGLTANRVVTTNASKTLTSSSVTDTELGYVSGVTSAIQTQLNTLTTADDPTQVTRFFQDFSFDNAGASTAAYSAGSQGGSSPAVAVVNNYGNSRWSGVFRLNGGSTTGLGVMYFSPGSANTAIRFGSMAVTYKTRLYFSALSNGTNRYYIRTGIGARVYSGETTGIYFRYTDNANSGNYVCVCRNGASETVINTSVTPSTTQNTPDVLSFSLNASGTSCEFFINGTSQGTTTTNIPTSTDLQIWAAHNNVSGGLGGNMDVDYYYATLTYNRG